MTLKQRLIEHFYEVCDEKDRETLLRVLQDFDDHLTGVSEKEMYKEMLLVAINRELDDELYQELLSL